MKNVAISWLELILLVLLTLGGMGIWVYVDQKISREMENVEPHKEDFHHNVLIYQTQLSTTQQALVSIQDKLLQKQLERDQLNIVQTTLINNYPQSKTVSSIFTRTHSIPAETIETYLETQIDLSMTQQLIDYLNSNLTSLRDAVATLSAELTQKQSPLQQPLDIEIEFSLIQDELETKQKLLVEQKLKLIEQEAAIKAMTAIYPELNVVSAVTTNTLTTTSEILDSYLNTQLEVTTTSNLVDMLNSDVNELADRATKLSLLLNENKQKSSYDIPIIESRLAQTQADLAATQENLIEQQQELARQTTILKVLSTTYPELGQIPTIFPTNKPVGILHVYLNNKIEIERMQDTLQTLEIQQGQLISETNQLSATLIEARQIAAQDYGKAYKSFEQVKQTKLIGWGLFYVGIMLVIVFLILWRLNWHKNNNIGIVFVGASSLLVILIAYQLFDLMGSAMVSIVLVLTLIGTFKYHQAGSIVEEG